ncbi:Regulatory protein, TetR [metagenome]|uniref:Regulatory protein, TetR n=1 Tax=metagenome TaxID=256318 RepID=A0A2P2C5Z8_9ZZZZ
MRTRATPMPPDERKRAIVAAALPLLREHGRETTTRQIAEAAGIAEGTIFRVFATKDDLFAEVLAQAFDPAEFLVELEGVDPALPLRERLLALTEVMQRRFVGIFSLMTTMAMQGPPKHHRGEEAEAWRRRTHDVMISLIAPDADAFRVPVEDVSRALRLLTFSGSHPHISEQRLMTPDEIVDVVLHGTCTKDSSC